MPFYIKIHTKFFFLKFRPRKQNKTKTRNCFYWELVDFNDSETYEVHRLSFLHFVFRVLRVRWNGLRKFAPFLYVVSDSPFNSLMFFSRQEFIASHSANFFWKLLNYKLFRNKWGTKYYNSGLPTLNPNLNSFCYYWKTIYISIFPIREK